MNRGEVVTAIRDKLGYNTGLDGVVIRRAIDDAQIQLETLPELPWFLESEITDFSTVAADEKLSLPSNFLMEIDEEPLYYYNTTGVGAVWQPLRKLATKELRELSAQADINSVATSGIPKFYSLQGVYYRLYPTPDIVYTLKQIYFGRLALMTSDDESNAWAVEAPWCLVGLAGSLISENSRDKEATAVFKSLFQSSYSNLMRRSEGREHAGQSYQRGGDD